MQRMHEQRNRLTGHLRNYASISGIPTHRMEIQTAYSTKSVDVCLTVISLHMLHTRLNNLEKGNKVGKFKPCIKLLHVNCTLKLPNCYKKKSQIYLFRHC